jgi:hypothetical protein
MAIPKYEEHSLRRSNWSLTLLRFAWRFVVDVPRLQEHRHPSPWFRLQILRHHRPCAVWLESLSFGEALDEGAVQDYNDNF